MKILTKEIIKQFEKQGYTGDKQPEDIKIIMKLFNPVGSQTWYLYEDMGDGIYMAYVNLGDPVMSECGTVYLPEILEIKLMLGLGIERDISFGFKYTLKEVMDKVRSGGHV